MRSYIQFRYFYEWGGDDDVERFKHARAYIRKTLKLLQKNI